jgi:shikimate kinase
MHPQREGRSAELFENTVMARIMDESMENRLDSETISQLFSRNIYLVGFMGAGKSTIADRLGQMLGMEKLDTDEMIVDRSGMSINEIFERFGEEYFRDLETAALKELAGCSGSIVSCGGGVTLRQENIEAMRSNGVIVWLTAQPETIYDRIHLSTTRPLLKNNNTVEGIARLLKERLARYENAADVIVATDGLGIDEVCGNLIEKSKCYMEKR